MSSLETMSYTSDTDESMLAIERWHPSKPYIVVSTPEPINDDYVIFEPNYRFSRFNKPELISQSTDANESVYLYNIVLPCPFNPYIYLFLNQTEVTAIEMLGNVETDSTVIVKRHLRPGLNDESPFDHDTEVSLSQLINEDDMANIQYDISNDGELTLQQVNKTESDFLLERYRHWLETQYRPYYYHDDNEPSSQIRLVYRNEQTEFDLLQQCVDYCSSIKVPKHTIDDFVQSLSRHFLHMFRTDTTDEQDVDHVRIIYTDYIRSLSPRNVLEFVGGLIHKIEYNHRNHHHHDFVNDDLVVETHYIVCADKITQEKTIVKGDPQVEALYTIEFRSSHFTISGRANVVHTIYYGDSEFEYAFLLLSE